MQTLKNKKYKSQFLDFFQARPRLSCRFFVKLMTLCICKKDIHLGPDHLLLLSRTYLQTINIIEQITKKGPNYNVEYQK